MRAGRRNTAFRRRPPVSVSLRISGILEISADGIRVVFEKTGKACWLPREHVQFYPGTVTVPDWLIRKMNTRGAATHG